MNVGFRMRGAALACAVVSLCLAPGLGAKALQDDAKPVTLKLKFKQDQVNTYTVSMKMNMMVPSPSGETMPMVTTSKMTTAQKVTKAYPDGSADMTSNISDQVTTVNDMEVQTPAIGPIVTHYDAAGNVKVVSGMEGQPGGDFVKSAFSGGVPSILLPANPVKVGDTWTNEFVIAAFNGKGKMKSTLVRIEDLGGYKTARIHIEVSIPVNLLLGQGGAPVKDESDAMMKMIGTVSGVGDVNLAIAAGIMVRSAMDSDMDFKMVPGKAATGNVPNLKISGKQNMTMTLKKGS